MLTAVDGFYTSPIPVFAPGRRFPGVAESGPLAFADYRRVCRQKLEERGNGGLQASGGAAKWNSSGMNKVPCVFDRRLRRWRPGR
ncbi:MAG: hypothetical protein ACRYG8_30325 [Janthinobacterium lividum]